ncbi:MAG: hypothetical protein ACHREM_20150 [Polyangiales bacterium]
MSDERDGYRFPAAATEAEPSTAPTRGPPAADDLSTIRAKDIRIDATALVFVDAGNGPGDWLVALILAPLFLLTCCSLALAGGQAVVAIGGAVLFLGAEIAAVQSIRRRPVHRVAWTSVDDVEVHTRRRVGLLTYRPVPSRAETRVVIFEAHPSLVEAMKRAYAPVPPGK